MPAVALLGPRQVGKTTLAHVIARGRGSVYLDLESPVDREKLADPTFYLAAHENSRVNLDEVQRMPDLFAVLRGLIDRGRQRGLSSGRFLLLGSASADLLRQSETLAGRVAYVELPPLGLLRRSTSPCFSRRSASIARKASARAPISSRDRMSMSPA